METIISIITPSFNQAEYINFTIESIISQKGNFYIDYIIIDGCSTDLSVEIIKKYEKIIKANSKIIKINNNDFHISINPKSIINCKGISYRWISEKDDGHGEALNKGFKLAVGDIYCWLNSDDIYFDNTFSIISDIFKKFHYVNWITGLNSIINKDGTEKQLSYLGTYNYRNVFSFLTGDYDFIQQECTFWRKDLWERAGAKINTDYKLMVDGELWCRFFLFDEIYHINKKLAAYRWHDTNRAQKYRNQVNEEMKKAVKYLVYNTSSKINEVCKSIYENIPFINCHDLNLNFKIIEFSTFTGKWSINEIDFFSYSFKRKSNKLRNLRYEIEEKSAEKYVKDIELKLFNKNEELKSINQTINQIINSKSYKLSNLILKPFRKFIN